MPSPQARYWLLTIPERAFDPARFGTYQEREGGVLPDCIQYVRGQLEVGEQNGYRHWQVTVSFRTKVTRTRVKSFFGDSAHCQQSRSAAVRDYVWKENTRVAGSGFEFGSFAIRRNSAIDWDSVWNLAVSGRLLEIESQLRVCHYASLRRIGSDFARAPSVERVVYCFIGRTGTGKSHRAWAEAGLAAYPKGPTSKFWDGYQGEQHVVIDEFRGGFKN